jgi:N6-L-threonylcarbamoyladenine synthase
MRILAIETSCDDTSFALVSQQDGRFVVEKNLVSSQVNTHALYGGVVPEVAARMHAEQIGPLLRALEIRQNGEDVNAIAVTAGPGLVPSLRVGVACAASLAWAWQKPLVAINHLEGHLYSCWLAQEEPWFPCIALLVSGGHTELILMKNHGSYLSLGRTRDDAAGEAFDKVAKLLELGYPGGPIISKQAQDGQVDAIAFPRPMLDSSDFDFSFSGLKTAVLYHLKHHPEDRKEDVCASFQSAVVDTLVKKTLRAVEIHKPKSVLLSGGVSANALLRNTLKQELAKHFPHVRYCLPPLSYTTDNAAMIGIAAYFHLQKNDLTDPLTLCADPNLPLSSL